jgi:hypothetical protein
MLMLLRFKKPLIDELKEVQKDKFSAAFLKLYDCTKPVYMPKKLILNFKKLCLPHVS